MTVIDATAEGETPTHACVVPISDEQLWEMTAAFLAEGLAAGEQVVFFDDGSAEAVLERLEDDRVPTRAPIASGQLTVVPPTTTRSVLAGPPQVVLDTLDALITDALTRGFPGIRLTGDSAYGMRNGDGTAMLAYESGYDDVLAGRPARVLCFYDQRRFSERDIERLRAVHHTELDSPAVYDDGMLRITATGASTARMAGEVDHSNRPRIRALLDAALDHALRSHSSAAEIVLDLASLRFLDVSGAVSLVHAAEEFPSTHTLVLTGVRPGVHRLLDRCGAPFAAQLRVEPRTAPVDPAAAVHPAASPAAPGSREPSTSAAS